MKPLLPLRLPLCVVALCWALAAQFYKTGAGGATYAQLKRLLGTSSDLTVYRTAKLAAAHGVVKVVRVGHRLRGGPRPLVMLKSTTLKQLEATWQAD